jgi:hypothetical protein
MTEYDAKMKWCPMVRFVIGEQNSLCLASACMMWRSTQEPSNNPTKEGFCGLGGKP